MLNNNTTPNDTRSLELTAEDADFLTVILRRAANYHPSVHVRGAAAELLGKLEILINK